jgi:hypothetical protein
MVTTPPSPFDGMGTGTGSHVRQGISRVALLSPPLSPKGAAGLCA